MKLNPADLPVVVLYNIDRSWSPTDISECLELVQIMVDGLSAAGHAVNTVSLEDSDLERAMSCCDPDRQIVFNWCEEVPGLPHSSSLVARKLEELGFVYTGTGPKALLFSQDKPAVKERLRKKHIPTPTWQVCTGNWIPDWERFPAIVKPAYEHSSIGITHDAVVHDHAELSQRVAMVAGTFHQPVLIEDFIDGREFHVTVIGNGVLRVLPIAEMDFSSIGEDRGRLCTYDSKFTPASSDYQMIQLRLPAELSAQEKQQLEEIAAATFRATGCRDFARLDIRLRDGTFYILDVNPNADISPDTSIMLSAGLAGFTFGEFASFLVTLAARRHPLLGLKKEKAARFVPAGVAV